MADADEVRRVALSGRARVLLTAAVSYETPGGRRAYQLYGLLRRRGPP